MANILVIDDDKSILRLLEFTIKRAGHNFMACGDGTQGLVQAEIQKPDLVVVDVMMPTMTGYEFCKQARTKPGLKEIPIIIFSARFQPIDRQTALQAGATDYIPKTTSPDELIRRINQYLATNKKVAITRAALGVFSLRGGCGVTTLAVNLAIALTRQQKMPAALVDLARLGGHAALMLGLRPTSSIAQMLGTANDITPEVVRPHLMQHESGVQLLASSHVYGYELALTDSRLPPLVTLLKSGLPLVVFDLPHYIEPLAAPLVQLFEKIVLVMSPDMPSMQSTAIALQSMARLGVTEDKITLVVNQVIPQGALSLETIQKSIKRSIAANIPFEPEMIKAVNMGKPLVLSSPTSAGANAIIGLAATLLG